MTSTTDGTTFRFHPHAPPIVCGGCGYRTARIASLIDAKGDVVGTVVMCLPCRERDRAVAKAARSAARPTRHALARLRSVPPTRWPASRRQPRPAASRTTAAR